MKKKILNASVSALAAFAYAYVTAICLDEILEAGANKTVLIVGLAAAALWASAAEFSPHLLLRLAAAAVPALLLVFRFRYLLADGMLILYRDLYFKSAPIRALIQNAAPDYTPPAPLYDPRAAAAALFLLCSILAYFTAVAVRRRANPFLPAAADLTVVVLLSVLTSRFPSALRMVLLLSLSALFLLAHLPWKADTAPSRRLALILIVPVLIVTGLCFDYVNRTERPAWADRAKEELIELWNSLKPAKKPPEENENPDPDADGEIRLLGMYDWNSSPFSVDLTRVGPETELPDALMEVYSDDARRLYLKGVTFGRYVGSAWEPFTTEEYRAAAVEEGRQGTVPPSSFFTTDSAPHKELIVRTRTPLHVFYLPYTPAGLPGRASVSSDSFVRIANGSAYYRVLYEPGAPYAPATWNYYSFIHTYYTEVPEETLDALKELGILERFTQSGSALVDEVAQFVRKSANYSLATPVMPDGADFVPWFLSESSTGYCVHFASAAVILLRSLGIPARYAAGYLVDAEGGEWTTVRASDAHAWAEYFDETAGSWRMLEVTPSFEEREEEPEESETYGTAPLPNLYERPELETEEEETEAPVQPATAARRRTGLAPLIAAVLFALAAWPFGVRAVRRRVLSRGDENRRAVTRYHRLTRLAKYAKTAVPDKLTGIAEKARFSPHTVTDDELKELDEACEELADGLRRSKNPIKWVFFRYLLAL